MSECTKHIPLFTIETPNEKFALIDIEVNRPQFSGRVVLDICVICHQLFVSVFEQRPFKENEELSHTVAKIVGW